MHIKLCKGQDLTRIDFGKHYCNSFDWHFEQMRKKYFSELQRSIKAKGFISRLIHKVAKIPPNYWVNV